MSSENWEHEFFEIMKAEHQELATVLREIRSAVSSEDRNRNQVEDLITRLSELMEVHFRHEEEGGYLKEALERAPRFTSKAESLLDQHEALQEEIEKLRLLVHSGMESQAWWTRIESDFHTFSDRLLNHEHAENKVVLEAFTDDIGTGD